jgi:hypothetical protein
MASIAPLSGIVWNSHVSCRSFLLFRIPERKSSPIEDFMANLCGKHQPKALPMTQATAAAGFRIRLPTCAEQRCRNARNAEEPERQKGALEIVGVSESSAAQKLIDYSLFS